jgi:hypothetical protein
VAVAYAALLSAYSTGLKHVIIVDTLIIAAGFVLRALAGVVVLDTELSHWLLLCTILLALFLTFGMRRHELLALEAGAAWARLLPIPRSRVGLRHRPLQGLRPALARRLGGVLAWAAPGWHGGPGRAGVTRREGREPERWFAAGKVVRLS